MAVFADPAWQLSCDSSSRSEEDWGGELRVAERVVRQLQAVGYALAWRVHRYDRRAIIALSRNDSPGPFVGKKGLGYELGSVIDHWRDRGHFTLLHDLTSVLRIADCTEVRADGFRMLQEVKASPRARVSKQVKRAEAALAAIDGTCALPAADQEVEIWLWRSHSQMKTHIRELRPLIDQAGTNGFWVGRVGGRVAGGVNLLIAAQSGEDPAAQLADYQSRLNEAIGRHLFGATRHMRAVSADVAARDPAIAPYGIFPLPTWHRAGLICDYIMIETFMAEYPLLNALQKRGMTTRPLLAEPDGAPTAEHHVFEATKGQRRLVLHGAAITQLLLEWIVVDRYAEAVNELMDTRDRSMEGVLTFSNEHAAWT